MDIIGMSREIYPYAGRLKQNLSWPVLCAVLIIVGCTCVFVRNVLPDWTFPIALVEIVMLVALFGYRHFWRFTWFWVRIVPVLLIRWPLVVWARPLVYRGGLPFNLLLANADGFLAILAVTLAGLGRNSVDHRNVSKGSVQNCKIPIPLRHHTRQSPNRHAIRMSLSADRLPGFVIKLPRERAAL